MLGREQGTSKIVQGYGVVQRVSLSGGVLRGPRRLARNANRYGYFTPSCVRSDEVAFASFSVRLEPCIEVSRDSISR